MDGFIVTHLSFGVLIPFLSFVSILGGWKLKVESRLTLKKEDTSLYHVVRAFNNRVCTPDVKLSLFTGEYIRR